MERKVSGDTSPSIRAAKLTTLRTRRLFTNVSCVYAVRQFAIGVEQIFRRDAEEFTDSGEEGGVSDERALARDHVRPACSG